MSLNFGGGSDSSTFQLGPVENIFDAGTGTLGYAENLRDTYAAQAPLWLTAYENNPSLNVLLLFNDNTGQPCARYTSRASNAWRTTSEAVALRGPSGDQGAAGDPAELIDDAQAALAKTYSSNKIEELLQNATGLPNAGAGTFLSGVDEYGNIAFTNLPLVNAADGTTIELDNIPSPSNALNITPSSYVRVLDNGGYLVLEADLGQLEADLVTLTSEVATKASTASVEQSFTNAAIYQDDVLGHMHNSGITATGYGNSRKIDYHAPVLGDHNNVVAAFPPAVSGNITFIHKRNYSDLGLLMIKETAITDMFNIDPTSLDTIAISMIGVRVRLGKGDQDATGKSYIWNLEGRSVAINSNPNEYINPIYVNATGIICSRDESVNACYSSGVIKHEDGVVFKRGGYCYDDTTKATIFVEDSNSAFFVLDDGKLCSNMFSSVEVFEVYQDAISANSLSYNASPSKILGSQLAAVRDVNTKKLTDLDERVIDLGSRSRAGLDTVRVFSEEDANGLAEGITMPSWVASRFDLAVNSSEHLDIGYVASLTNAIRATVIVESKTDPSKSTKLYVSIDNGVLLVLETEYNHSFGIALSSTVVNDRVMLVANTTTATLEDVTISVRARVL